MKPLFGMIALVATAFVGSALLSPRADAQATAVYEYQHWKIDDTTTGGVSTLTFTLNNLAADGWELVGTPFAESQLRADGTLGIRYNVIARKPRPTAVPVAPAPTTISCPSEPHPACRMLPSGTYDRAWANAVVGIQ